MTIDSDRAFGVSVAEIYESHLVPLIFEPAAFAEARRDLLDGGFINSPDVATVEVRSRADFPMTAAFAYCQGTPLRNEIEMRDASALAAATKVAPRH
jgi:hypothetical protein